MALARFALVLLLMGGAAVSQQYVISTVAGGAPIPTPIAATRASLGLPGWVAVGSSGEVYFTAYHNHSVYKCDARGILSRVAGTGRPGFSGDGGPATAAQLNNPRGIAVDVTGNLFIADYSNSRVRKVAANGIITTIAGTGSSGDSGDGIPATSARVNAVGVAVDATGNLFFSENIYHRIRKVATNGIITTVAGNGSFGYSGDGGPATVAQLNRPYGVTTDATGSLYIADSGNNRIRKVATNGIITTFAGNGSAGFSGDGGPATAAQLYLNADCGVAVDVSGILYVGDGNNQRIRKVASDGKISTIAGNVSGYSGDGGPASSAQLFNPRGVAVDAIGNLYVADYSNHRMRKVGTNGVINTIAGDGSNNYSGDGGPATIAQLNDPQGVTTDATGSLYITDSGNNRIRKVATNGIIVTVAGNGSKGYSGDGGPATAAELNYPSHAAVDAMGNLYFADSLSNRIRKVAPNGIITTVAGSGSKGYSGDGGPAIIAQLNYPRGVAVDGIGNLYISDVDNHRIRKVATNGIITTIAGNGSQGYSGDGGAATTAQLDYMYGVAVDAAGSLYIAGGVRIRKVATNGIITTIAGNGSQGYSGDGGPATSTQLSNPSGVAVDAVGNLYIADSGRIRKVATNGIITTIAGNGSQGYSGDGGPATSAAFFYTSSLAADAAATVYFADPGNNAIRMLKPMASLLTASALANAASNLTLPVSPGEIVVVYGSGIGPAQLVQARVDDQGRYGTTLAGTRVLFNGTPAPMLYSWATQTSAIVPYNLSGTTASVQVEYQGAKTDPITVSVAASAPGVFTLDASGKGQAAAINEDGSLNTASRPAKAGSIVSLYATGEGQTTPAGRDGEPISPPLPKPVLPVQVTIDGKPAEVLYAGGAPGIVAGLMQINARIPANAQVGAVPVVVTVGSASSQSGVTVAVTGN